MNQRISELLTFYTEKKHHVYRQRLNVEQCESFSDANLDPITRVAKRLEFVLGCEQPMIFPNEKIAFLRTVTNYPDIFTKSEWDQIKSKNYIHELGNVCNISPNYEATIRKGLLQERKEILETLERLNRVNDTIGIRFLESVLTTIDAVQRLVDKYQKEAEKEGNIEVAQVLAVVPREGARTFHQALQFFRILHFTLWAEGEYHNTVGRFDQYMYPYLKADLDAGRLDDASALDLLEEFFITFNKDSDLYPGVQQGDNGQSMVLGGVDKDGKEAFNLLSQMCLEASRDLKLIDPKINLRVWKDSKKEIYELGTELTKEGLGFPQYSNDEIIIPGLLAKGYDLEDARNYVVAACWEFIIPGVGMDIPNIGALSFPAAVDKCIRSELKTSATFEELMVHIIETIVDECNEITNGFKDLWMIPAPFMSVLMDGCLERGRDISQGSKYNNFGIHGTGLSTAVDALAAIKRYIFDDKSLTAESLISALDADFEGYEELYVMLRFDAPKMGNDDDYADEIAKKLLESFADALQNKVNERNGCYRPGTGSAMYYLWHARETGASADGRKKGEAFGANYSPSLYAKLKGPISLIRSFVKPDLKKTINGGPLTMEFHSTLFQDKESLKKVAMLVKSFVDLGGHQLQLNAVNRDVLVDAQKSPSNHRNLIVRIWGWSAYFVELDQEYQNHVINRQEYM